MTNAQFDALAQLLRLRGNASQRAARAVLVHGQDITDAAAAAGVTYHAAYRVVVRVKDGLKLARIAACAAPSAR